MILIHCVHAAKYYFLLSFFRLSFFGSFLRNENQKKCFNFPKRWSGKYLVFLPISSFPSLMYFFFHSFSFSSGESQKRLCATISIKEKKMIDWRLTGRKTYGSWQNKKKNEKKEDQEEEEEEEEEEAKTTKIWQYSIESTWEHWDNVCDYDDINDNVIVAILSWRYFVNIIYNKSDK